MIPQWQAASRSLVDSPRSPAFRRRSHTWSRSAARRRSRANERELRRGDEVIATGHFSREQPLEIGERITIGSRSGIVRDVGPILGELELRLAGTAQTRDLEN